MEVPPDLAVSLGTAIMANMKAQSAQDEIPRMQLIDGYAYGIGVEILTGVGNDVQLVYDPLSRPNTTIPYSVTKDYTLVYAEQESLELRVYQTLNPHTRSLAEAEFTGISAKIEDIPPSLTGIPHPITIDFSINTDQMIELFARIPATNQSLVIKASTNELRIEDEEIFNELKDQLDDWW